MLVEHNFIHDPVDNGIHNDGIQSQRSDGLTITRNTISFQSVAPYDGPNQGIILNEDCTLPNGLVTNSVISNNLIAHWNAGRPVELSGVNGVKVVNNTLLDHPEQALGLQLRRLERGDLEQHRRHGLRRRGLELSNLLRYELDPASLVGPFLCEHDHRRPAVPGHDELRAQVDQPGPRDRPHTPRDADDRHRRSLAHDSARPRRNRLDLPFLPGRPTIKRALAASLQGSRGLRMSGETSSGG
jgi:hypothetical protein